MAIEIRIGRGYKLALDEDGRVVRRYLQFGLHPLAKGGRQVFEESVAFQERVANAGIQGVLRIPKWKPDRNLDIFYPLAIAEADPVVTFDTDLFFLAKLQPELLTGRFFAGLLVGVIGTLLEIREQFGRTHGRLGLGSVLLAWGQNGPPNLRTQSITDFSPCPDAKLGDTGRDNLVRFEREDLRALDQIILQVASGRLTQDEFRLEDFPPGTAPEARRFGEDYREWQGLVRDLFDPHTGIRELHSLGTRLHRLADPGLPCPAILKAQRRPYRPPDSPRPPESVPPKAPGPLLSPPAISGQPDDLDVIVGRTAELRTVVIGSPPFEFQWRKEGRPIPGATATVYEVPSVTAAAAGSYDVVIRNAVGEIISRTAMVNVVGPPVIIRQPSAQIATLGSTAQLQVEAESPGPITCQWRRDGLDIPGAVETALLLRPVTPVDAGLYTVEVRNDWGSAVSREARLTVLVPPALTLGPEDQTVDAGVSIEFRCQATGSGPLQYQWRKNGVPLPGRDSAILSIPAVSTADGGDYDVVVRNDAGEVTSRAATLSVLGPPVVRRQPADQIATSGSPAEFRVEAESVGPFSCQWRRDGVDLPDAAGTTLSIESATQADAGVYTVELRNQWGSVVSREARLEVRFYPIFTLQPIDQAVYIGAAAEFQCQAVGSGPLRYQWRKDGVPLPGENSANLRISVTNWDTAGRYDLVVANDLGEDTSRAASLTILAPPEIIDQPAHWRTRAGKRARFRFLARGTPPLRIQWRKDGEDVPNATDEMLEFETVSSRDAGAYDAVVSNDHGWTSTQPAILSVARPIAWGKVLAVGVVFSLIVAASWWIYDWITDPVQVAMTTANAHINKREFAEALKALNDAPTNHPRYADVENLISNLTRFPGLEAVTNASRYDSEGSTKHLSFFPEEARSPYFPVTFRVREPPKLNRMWTNRILSQLPVKAVTNINIGMNIFQIVPLESLQDGVTVEFELSCETARSVKQLVLKKLNNSPPKVDITPPKGPVEAEEKITIEGHITDGTRPFEKDLTYRWTFNPAEGVDVDEESSERKDGKQVFLMKQVTFKDSGDYTAVLTAQDGGEGFDSKELPIVVRPARGKRQEMDWADVTRFLSNGQLKDAEVHLITNSLPDTEKEALRKGLSEPLWPSQRSYEIKLQQGSTRLLEIEKCTATNRVQDALSKVPWTVSIGPRPEGLTWKLSSSPTTAAKGLDLTFEAAEQAPPGELTLVVTFAPTEQEYGIEVRVNVKIEKSARTTIQDKRNLAMLHLSDKKWRAALDTLDILKEMDAGGEAGKWAAERILELKSPPTIRADLQPCLVPFGTNLVFDEFLRTNVVDTFGRTSWAVTDLSPEDPAGRDWKREDFNLKFKVTDIDGVAESTNLVINCRGVPNKEMELLDRMLRDLERSTGNVSKVLSTLSGLPESTKLFPSNHIWGLTNALSQITNVHKLELKDPSNSTPISVVAGETNFVRLRVERRFKANPDWTLQFEPRASGLAPSPDRPDPDVFTLSYTPPPKSLAQKQSVSVWLMAVDGKMRSNTNSVTFEVMANQAPKVYQRPTIEKLKTAATVSFRVIDPEGRPLSVKATLNDFEVSCTSRQDDVSGEYEVSLSERRIGDNTLVLIASDGVNDVPEKVDFTFEPPNPLDPHFALRWVADLPNCGSWPHFGVGGWVGSRVVTWKDLKDFLERALPDGVDDSGEALLLRDEVGQILQQIQERLSEISDVPKGAQVVLLSKDQVWECHLSTNINFRLFQERELCGDNRIIPVRTPVPIKKDIGALVEDSFKPVQLAFRFLLYVPSE